MDSSTGTPRPDTFTQGCRDLVRTFTYEDIVACTIYVAPMVFMIGPASIIAMEPVLAILVQSVFGFVLGWAVHRVGHRLLIGLPTQPHRFSFSPSWASPFRLTVTQVLWGLECIVGAAVFCAVLGKRSLQSGEEWLSGFGLLVAALVLYFVPVYLGRCWIRAYYPAMTLVGPTEDIIKTSLPGIRFLSNFTQTR